MKIEFERLSRYLFMKHLFWLMIENIHKYLLRLFTMKSMSLQWKTTGSLKGTFANSQFSSFATHTSFRRLKILNGASYPAVKWLQVVRSAISPIASIKRSASSCHCLLLGRPPKVLEEEDSLFSNILTTSVVIHFFLNFRITDTRELITSRTLAPLITHDLILSNTFSGKAYVRNIQLTVSEVTILVNISFVILFSQSSLKKLIPHSVPYSLCVLVFLL